MVIIFQKCMYPKYESNYCVEVVNVNIEHCSYYAWLLFKQFERC